MPSPACSPPASWWVGCSITITPAVRGWCRVPCSASSPATAPASTSKEEIDPGALHAGCVERRGDEVAAAHLCGCGGGGRRGHGLGKVGVLKDGPASGQNRRPAMFMIADLTC